MAKALTWRIKQGETFVRTLEFKNLDGTPKDLTGYTFAGEVRAASDSPVVLTLPITVEPLLGRVTITLDKTATRGIPAKRWTVNSKPITVYFCDLEQVNPVGAVLPLFEIKIEATPEITKNV